jgi:hypothetical protein
MEELGAEMTWTREISHRGRIHSGWRGTVPLWAAERPQPPGLAELLAGDRLQLAIAYPEGFPMIPPVLIPLNDDERPLVPIQYRTMQEWHVMGDGSLCQLQSAAAWQPTDTAADLLVEASGWYAEYRLMCEQKIERMTEKGIGIDLRLDSLIATYAPDD